jgi:hypothetical protein
VKTSCIFVFSFFMACSSGEENAQEPSAATNALQEALDEAAAEAAEATAEPAAEALAVEAPAAEEPTGTRYTCNQASNHLCYQIAPPSFTLAGEQAGCEGIAGIGTWTEGGECPTENIIGTCQKERNNETRYFYEGVTAEQAEPACTMFGGTFTASE